MLSRLFLTAAIIVSTIPTVAFAFSSYDEELSEHAGELRALMIRAEQYQALDADRRIELDLALFELQKKLNRLEEEAASASVALQRSGRQDTRGLVFATAVAESLNLARAHTQAYLDTGDEAFKLSATQAAKIARDLMSAQ